MKSSGRVGVSKKRLEEARDAERRQTLFSSPDFRAAAASVQTHDSFQNFQLNLGLGTDNALSGSTYGFNPITRNRILLEWMHRGSWLAGVAVDLVADDMTRAGIEITAGLEPDEQRQLHGSATRQNVWPAINDVIKWSRLYGGAIGVIDIDGQDAATELNLDTVAAGQFLGVYALDRWMVEPSLWNLVPRGAAAGSPTFYRANSSSPVFRFKKIHYSRCIRLDGIRLPWQQRQMENLWGISVLERLHDRIVAFDSATMGAAQLVYKAHLRTMKIKKLRETLSGPPQVARMLINYVETMRRFQGIEGVTLIDEDDEFDTHQATTFSGIGDALMQFGQQLAGALQIPLVRLFGMSPAGFSATGESDLRTYYDNIKQRQERDLRIGVEKIYRALAKSEGMKLGEDFDFGFASLYQMDEPQKAEVAERITAAVVAVQEAGIFGQKTALSELRQVSRVTGVFSHITDEMIDEASDDPPEPEIADPETEESEGVGEGAGEGEGEGPRPTPEKPSRLRLARLPAADGRNLLPGVDVIVETPRGATRYPHRRQLPCAYGHIRGTRGADGEQVDCYIGDALDGAHDAWIIDQVHPDTGKFDEHKIMLGFPTRQLALRAYQRSFDDASGAARIGAVTQMPVDRLSDWLADPDRTRRPASAAA